MNTETAPGFCDAMSQVDALLHARTCLRLRNILVPIDFTEISLRAIPYAHIFAQQFCSTVTLFHAVHLNIVGEERGIPLGRFLEEMKSAAGQVLREVASSLRSSEVRIVVKVGEPAGTILDEVAESDIDLIVLGRHRRKKVWSLLGPSVGKKVICRAPCPTFIVS